MAIIELNKNKIYPKDTLKHLHDVQLMILEDFITFCDKHDIVYFMDGGSVLGAIRHEGFIPWDDDVDVLLLRNQYEKFLEYSHELTDKYDILNSDNYDYYCRLYSKISLKGTKIDALYDNNTDYEFGINIDIFVYDNLPDEKIQRTIFKLHRDIFDKFLWMYEIITCDLYLSKNKERIGHLIRFLFKIFDINNKKLKKWGNKLVNKSKSFDSHHVCNLSSSYKLYSFENEIFNETKEVKFENLIVNVPFGFDDYLCILYGDYMELPPKEERINHGFNYIDFGKY